MTDQSFPITPPPELVQQWYQDAEHQLAPYYFFMTRCAAQWGWDQRGTINEAQLQERADQELEACYYWIENYHGTDAADSLQHGRRPKPPSLKEQALADLEQLLDIAKANGVFNPPDTIRRALEALGDD
jgi:hypothetical protein